MKTFLTKFLSISSIALLMVASCKKDEVKTMATNGKGGTLQASSTTIVLTKADVGNTAVTFNFSNADFGYKAAVTNVLQIDVPDDNFAHPKEFNIPTNTFKQSFSVPDFNSLLLALNLPTGLASQVQARIKSSISTATSPTYSNALDMTVTPFALVAYVYVPGAYQGWSPASADSLQSATGNGVYTGVINFKGTTDYTYKVTSGKTGNITWYGNLNGAVSGDGAASNFVFTDKTTVDPAVNIMSDMVTIDLNQNTIKMVPTLWSVVGDATPGGWPAGSGYQSDTDMKYNNGTQTWSVVVALKAGGGIKFRLNHDWGTNYGSTTPGGILDTNNNNNIAITADGNYLVTIDINHLTYSLVKQ